MSRALGGIGVPVDRVVACRDLEEEMMAVFAESLGHMLYESMIEG